jgi:para-aminobenzoate synthetase component 1
MLSWASRFNIFCFLDNNNYPSSEKSFEWMMAAGESRSIILQRGNAFEELQNFFDEQPSWLFGHLGYGINGKYNTASIATDDFADGFFFSPQILLRYVNDELMISSFKDDATDIYTDILDEDIATAKRNNINPIESSLSKVEYCKIVEHIRQHILRGDCYVLNFCQDFNTSEVHIDPVTIFRSLQEISPNPFSAFYRVKNNYCFCASPERFLKKSGNVLISQPIKGTSRRGNDEITDMANKSYLLNSSKEKSENVMVVDLVRNDLSRVCIEGSVNVAELFGIYSFPQVHQMISTVKGILSDDVAWTKALEAAFPMGSMTGAPKFRVMELIDQYETMPRGLFSGSIGYITPDADFDFNVVIRSIFYNETGRYLNFKTGGAITFYSNAEAEYEECLLKAAAIIKVLNPSG